ncbi:hypothetical protein [Myroides injenensis]|uniref:hypothetical protein n=1 Tax=Myroides injenensis TaxID=1183151 RepID=UPI0002892F4F|nr:hypothetical protein [Myroides injenensis]
MEKASLYTHYFKKVEKAIAKMSKQNVKDIYAISFWKSNVDDDPRCPIISISYNTYSQIEEEKDNASSEQEAKWNFAFWLQDEITMLGGEDKVLRQYLKEEGYFYTLNEQSKAEKLKDKGDNTAYNEISMKDDKIQSSFMEIIIRIAKEIQKSDLIKEKIGKELPIIIHELEYYDLPLEWTKKANPPQLIEEFLACYE